MMFRLTLLLAGCATTVYAGAVAYSGAQGGRYQTSDPWIRGGTEDPWVKGNNQQASNIIPVPAQQTGIQGTGSSDPWIRGQGIARVSYSRGSSSSRGSGVRGQGTYGSGSSSGSRYGSGSSGNVESWRRRQGTSGGSSGSFFSRGSSSGRGSVSSSGTRYSGGSSGQGSYGSSSSSRGRYSSGSSGNVESWRAGQGTYGGSSGGSVVPQQCQVLQNAASRCGTGSDVSSAMSFCIYMANQPSLNKYMTDLMNCVSPGIPSSQDCSTVNAAIGDTLLNRNPSRSCLNRNFILCPVKGQVISEVNRVSGPMNANFRQRCVSLSVKKHVD